MNLTRISTGAFFLFLSLFVFIFPLSAQQAGEEDSAETADVVPADYDDEDLDYLFFEAPDLVFEAPRFQIRSLDAVFPNLSRSEKRIVMDDYGLRYSFDRKGGPSIMPASNSGISLYNSVMQRNPSHVVEALVVVPYNERELDLLDIYNALGRVTHIKDQILVYSSGRTLAVFKDTTRLDNAQSRRAIPDPAPTNRLPYSETMYVRFTDNYIGNLFLRGDITQSLYGLTYNLTNFRDVNFSIFRIMKSERISIILYLEPVTEGILIYSMAGFFLPDFIMSRLNLTVNINNRITVLLNWIVEGLRIQETIAVDRVSEPIEGLIQNERFNRLINN